MDLLGNYGSDDSEEEQEVDASVQEPSIASKFAALPGASSKPTKEKKKKKKKEKKEKKEKVEVEDNKESAEPVPVPVTAYRPMSINAAPGSVTTKRPRPVDLLAPLPPSEEETSVVAVQPDEEKPLDPTAMYWESRAAQAEKDKRRRVAGTLVDAKGALGSFSMGQDNDDDDDASAQAEEGPAPGPQRFGYQYHEPVKAQSVTSGYGAARARAQAAAEASADGIAGAVAGGYGFGHPEAMSAPSAPEGLEADTQFRSFAKMGKGDDLSKIQFYNINASDLTHKSEQELRLQAFEEKFEQQGDVSVQGAFWNSKTGQFVNTGQVSKLNKRKHQINQLARSAALAEADLAKKLATGAAARKAAKGRYGF